MPQPLEGPRFLLHCILSSLAMFKQHLWAGRSIRVVERGKHQPGHSWHPAQTGGRVLRTPLPCPIPKSRWISPATPAPAGRSPTALSMPLPSSAPPRKHQCWSLWFTGLLWGPTSHSHSCSPHRALERGVLSHLLLTEFITITLSLSQARGSHTSPVTRGILPLAGVPP